MPFTNAWLDSFVSKGLSQLTECGAGDLAGRPEESAFWVRNFLLNSTFRSAPDDRYRRFAFALLRRAEMAFAEYDLGREALCDYLSGAKDRVSVYFKALYHFEQALAQLSQAATYASYHVGQRKAVFKSGPWKRLNILHQQTKHFEKHSAEMMDGQFHILQITNEGLRSTNNSLTFQEIEATLLEVGAVANLVSDPAALVEEIRKRQAQADQAKDSL